MNAPYFQDAEGAEFRAPGRDTVGKLPGQENDAHVSSPDTGKPGVYMLDISEIVDTAFSRRPLTS